jgi:hypothetical protein
MMLLDDRHISALTIRCSRCFIRPMTPWTDADAGFASDRLAAGCGTLEKLLTGLDGSQGRVAEEVHAIRKLGKTLRGGFALFRLEESAAREIQVIGRLLSGSRDAVSRLSTWNKLGWKTDETTSAAIAGLLAQQTHSAACRPPPETLCWCVERVRAARDELTQLPPGSLPPRIEKGISKLRKQVILRCRHLDHRAEEDFHDARKALKAYLGAMEFLPGNAIPPEPVMADLTELLGDENDLATLATWLLRHGFTRGFAPDLWQLIRKTRKKIRKQAMADAAILIV